MKILNVALSVVIAASYAGAQNEPVHFEVASVKQNMSATPTSVVGTNITMPQLATRLSRSIGVIVTDQTGLSGAYDFKLEWPAEEAFTSPGASANASIYAALQEQLGLRLESTRGPVEILVIDHVEKPTEN